MKNIMKEVIRILIGRRKGGAAYGFSNSVESRAAYGFSNSVESLITGQRIRTSIV